MTAQTQTPATMLAEVGAFKFLQNDSGETFVEGPEDYLHPQGAQLLAHIAAGEDAIFSLTCGQSATFEIAVLVRLQNDYAGWRGVQQFCTQHEID